MNEKELATKSFIITNQTGDDRFIFQGAMQQACIEFDIDKDGHINGVDGADRSDCCTRVRLLHKEVEFGMNGPSYNYYFEASVVKNYE